MRNTTIALIALAVLLWAGGAAARADDEADKIRQIDANWVDAVARKDPAAIAGFYTEDGNLLAPGMPIVKGRDAIASAWKSMVGMKDFSLTFSPTSIEIAGSKDMAYEIGTYKLGFTGDKGPVEDKGKYVVVWKAGDGGWKAVADTFNSDGSM